MGCFLVSSSFGQRKTEEPQQRHFGIDDSQMWHSMKIGQDQIKQRSFYNAVNSFSIVLESYPKNQYVLYHLAKAYFLGRDYVNAEKYYKQLVKLNKKPKQGLTWFELGETYKYLGEYELAQRAFSNFIKNKSKDPEIKLAKKWSKTAKNYCKYAWSMSANDSALFHVDVLSDEINSGYTDFSPSTLGKDTLYFASLRQDSILTYDRNEHTPSNVNIYYSVKDEDDDTWGRPVLQQGLAKEFDHVANGTFGPNNKIYYSKCHQNASNEIVCGIYARLNLGNSKYGKEEKIGSKVNKRGYTTTQPTFGSYTKKKRRKVTTYHVMYFASNRPGGKGGMDIWYAPMDAKGKFGAPVNCGRGINTIRDEVTPFYQDETKKLFYSSNYKYGLGGFDVFVSEGNTKRFRKSTNLAMPINSSYDDTYFVPYPDTLDGNNFGYLVSNRPGGHALASETCCDDIYRFESFIPDTVTFDLMLTEVITKEKSVDSTSNVRPGQPGQDSTTLVSSPMLLEETVGLDGARVGYLAKWKYDFRRAEDSTLKPDDLDAMVTWSTKKSKDGKVDLDLRDDYDYLIYVEHPNHKDTVIFISQPRDAEKLVYHRVEEKKKPKAEEKEPIIQSLATAMTATKIQKAQKFVLENMYFEYNMDIVKKESDESLDLLHKFLTNNPGVKIEIAGHTDSRGTEEYNLDLSQRRAESVVDKMIAKGIKANRMVAKGYGESQPIANNKNTDGTDNAKGRRLNRRTEVVILSSKR